MRGAAGRDPVGGSDGRRPRPGRADVRVLGVDAGGRAGSPPRRRPGPMAVAGRCRRGPRRRDPSPRRRIPSPALSQASRPCGALAVHAASPAVAAIHRLDLLARELGLIGNDPSWRQVVELAATIAASRVPRS